MISPGSLGLIFFAMKKPELQAWPLSLFWFPLMILLPLALNLL